MPSSTTTRVSARLTNKHAISAIRMLHTGGKGILLSSRHSVCINKHFSSLSSSQRRKSSAFRQWQQTATYRCLNRVVTKMIYVKRHILGRPEQYVPFTYVPVCNILCSKQVKFSVKNTLADVLYPPRARGRPRTPNPRPNGSDIVLQH